MVPDRRRHFKARGAATKAMQAANPDYAATMFGWLTLHVAALVLVATLFGGMLTFMALFAPLIFRTLPEAAAAAFLRDVFPAYYRSGGIVALLAALPLVPAHAYPAEIAALVFVAAGFVGAYAVLCPAISRAREEERDRAFRRLHRLSVAIHLAQFLAVGAVLIRLAQ